MKLFKILLGPLYRYICNLSAFFWDYRLRREIPITYLGKKILSIYDYGKITRFRASTFEIKEPETLRWINSFTKGETLIDIGANVGIYSLYAAYKDINVISIEPDALNYALLNLNIRLNNLGKLITPFCNAIHDEQKFSKFNISSFDWGGALNSFDNTLDNWGNQYYPVHSQAIFGITLDSFAKEISIIPNHIKIDVDGNEYLILKGGREVLSSESLKSILIELDINREDYEECIDIIEGSGFKLLEKTHPKSQDKGRFAGIFNHIFIK